MSGVQGRGGKGWGTQALVVLGAALSWFAAASPCLPVEPPVPDERVLYKDVVGKVVDPASGKPVAGASVSLLYETAVTDEKGAFRFAKVPINHTAQVSLRVRSRAGGYVIGCITVDVPVRFYPIAASVTERVGVGDAAKVVEKSDVQIVDPGADEAVVLRPKGVPSPKVDAYCRSCHERNPCVDIVSFEAAAKSGGKELRGILVYEDEVEEYKKKLIAQGVRRESYQKIRYQDTHPAGMNMSVIAKLELAQYKGRYKKPPALRLVDDKLVTCDTCHTRHVPTEQRQYVVMSFDKDSTLCNQCHL